MHTANKTKYAVKLLFFALSLLFFALLPQKALAASDPSVMLSSAALSAEHPYYKNGGGPAGAADYNAFFDAESRTLTIRDLEVEADFRDGICAQGGITLVLKGNSTILINSSINNMTPVYSGIRADDLTIKGEGALTISRSADPLCGKGDDYGIWVGNAEFQSGTVNILYADSCGVRADGTLRFTGGSLKASQTGTGVTGKIISVSGGQVDAAAFRTGISADRFLMTGGRVSASASNPSGTGLSAGKLSIMNGTLTAAGGRYGIFGAAKLCGGQITASGRYSPSDETGGAFRRQPSFGTCGSYTLKAGADSSHISQLEDGADLDTIPYVLVRYQGAVTHVPGDPVRENEHPANCKYTGFYDEAVYCKNCGGELSRERFVLDRLTTHTPGLPTRENEKAASYTKAASYQAVTRCTVCKKELQRETVFVGAPLLEISCLPDGHTISVSGGVSEHTRVLLASYGEGGRLLSCIQPENLSSIPVEPGAEGARLFFLSPWHSPQSAVWYTQLVKAAD